MSEQFSEADLAGTPPPSIPPPPHAPEAPPAGPKPTKYRTAGIVILVIGLLAVGLGIARVIPGGIGTGASFAFLGILLIALSFIRLPVPASDEPPMSGPQKLLGIFYEPTRVFRNLRSHPHWLAALLVVGTASAVYNAAFVQRLTPERIVDFTFEKLADSPIKPPPDRMEESKRQALEQEKQPIQRVQTFLKSYVFMFIMAAFVGTLCLLAVLAFGGRINFWQSLAAVLYSYVPVVLITKVVSLILLYIKSPDDIHPALNRDSLVQDNLGILIKPADHPALFVLAASIGILSFYGLWLRAKGLANAGTKVSSSTAWGVSITLWVLALLLGMVFATMFSSFMS
jgi:hypothetical protein